jgi:hypothetical protein
MTWCYEDWLAGAERLETLRAESGRRAVRYQKLAEHGVAQEIAGGCGTVRVNAGGVVRGIEFDLTNARVAGEQRLAAWLVEALTTAWERAERLQQLIAEQ